MLEIKKGGSQNGDSNEGWLQKCNYKYFYSESSSKKEIKTLSIYITRDA